jgi:hypothetical protein
VVLEEMVWEPRQTAKQADLTLHQEALLMAALVAVEEAEVPMDLQAVLVEMVPTKFFISFNHLMEATHLKKHKVRASIPYHLQQDI